MKLPLTVLYRPGLTANARLLWAALMDYASLPDGARPSHATLTARLGLSPSVVDRAARELKHAGLLRAERRWQTKAGPVECETRPPNSMPLPSRYVPLDGSSDTSSDATSDTRSGATVTPPAGQSDIASGVRSRSDRSRSNNQINQPDSRLSALKARDGHVPATFVAGASENDEEIKTNAEAVALRFGGNISATGIAHCLVVGYTRGDFDRAYTEWGNRRLASGPIRDLAAWIIPKIGDLFAERNNGAKPPKITRADLAPKRVQSEPEQR